MVPGPTRSGALIPGPIIEVPASVIETKYEINKSTNQLPLCGKRFPLVAARPTAAIHIINIIKLITVVANLK